MTVIVAILILIVALPLFVCSHRKHMNGKYRIVYFPAVYEVQCYYPKYVDGGFDPADARYDWDWHAIKQFATLEEAKTFLEKDKAERLAEHERPKSRRKIVYRD